MNNYPPDRLHRLESVPGFESPWIGTYKYDISHSLTSAEKITRLLLIQAVVSSLSDWQNKFNCRTSLRRERSSFNSTSLSHGCQTFTLTQTKLQPHDPHLPYYILQLFPSYCSLCANVCVFAQRKQRLHCDCAVRCSCVRFRFSYTKDEVKDEWNEESKNEGAIEMVKKITEATVRTVCFFHLEMATQFFLTNNSLCCNRFL